MVNRIAVSIIIPVYNCPGYLSGAVESVLAQSRSDWELIIVDDGSDDGKTPALCDSFKSDPRIRVFHTSNRGVSEARNFALPLAKGDFFSFLDADDLLHPDFLKLNLDAAEKTGAEIVFGEIDFFKKDFKTFDSYKSGDISVYSPEFVIEKALYQTGFDNCVCGKIYRRDLWKGLRFKSGRRYEDLGIFYQPIFKASKIALIPIPLYGYRQHEASYIHNFTIQHADVLEVTDEIYIWTLLNMPQILPAAADRRFSAHFNILMSLYKNRINNPELEARCLTIIRFQQNYSLRNPSVRPKNRIGALVSILGGRRVLRLLSHFPGIC